MVSEHSDSGSSIEFNLVPVASMSRWSLCGQSVYLIFPAFLKLKAVSTIGLGNNDEFLKRMEKTL